MVAFSSYCVHCLLQAAFPTAQDYNIPTLLSRGVNASEAFATIQRVALDEVCLELGVFRTAAQCDVWQATHVNAINSTIVQLCSKFLDDFDRDLCGPVTACTYNFSLRTADNMLAGLQSIIAIASSLEDVGVSAYLGQASFYLFWSWLLAIVKGEAFWIGHAIPAVIRQRTSMTRHFLRLRPALRLSKPVMPPTFASSTMRYHSPPRSTLLAPAVRSCVSQLPSLLTRTHALDSEVCNANANGRDGCCKVAAANDFAFCLK